MQEEVQLYVSLSLHLGTPPCFSWLQFLIHNMKELEKSISKFPSKTKDTITSRDRDLSPFEAILSILKSLSSSENLV